MINQDRFHEFLERERERQRPKKGGAKSPPVALQVARKVNRVHAWTLRSAILGTWQVLCAAFTIIIALIGVSIGIIGLICSAVIWITS